MGHKTYLSEIAQCVVGGYVILELLSMIWTSAIRPSDSYHKERSLSNYTYMDYTEYIFQQKIYQGFWRNIRTMEFLSYNSHLQTT